MNRFIISFFAMLLFSIASFAQITVTGTVTDSYGPLQGATVSLQGTTVGSMADEKGNFSIKVPNAQTAVLLFRFIGMNEIVEPLHGRTSGINVKMIEQANQMEDIVVVGYGTQKRVNITGSVASVSGDVLVKTPANSVAEAMVGKLPGVQITSVDGSPDADIMIRVRGGGSITQDNSPLILVDGFEVANLNDIPPSDIESIDVLKDASTKSIYGARGANGVILVTTKQPTEGRVTVNVNSYWQIKTLANRLDVMDPYEFVLMQYEYERQRSSNPTGFYNKYGQAYELYKYQGIEGVDWQDEIFGSNPVARFTDININGGTQRTKYKLSLANQDQPGVLVGSGLKQTNINFTLNTKLTDRLTLEYRTRFTNKAVDGDGTDGVNLLDALRTAPTEGLDDFMTLPEDNSYFDPDEYTQVTRMNPKEKAENNYRKRIRRTFNTSAALTWNVWDKLSFRTEFVYNYGFNENKRFWGKDEKTALDNKGLPVIRWESGNSRGWQFTNRLNYDFKVDMHSFDLMVGQEINQSESKNKSFSVRYFPDDITASKAFDNISLGKVYNGTSTAGSPEKLSSFFGRLFYGYNDRYLATFTMRADGSSKFAKGNQWGIFPAGSLAWRISQEEFMANVKAVSNLKLRLDYGISGNNRIESDLFAKYYTVNGNNRPVGWGDSDEENHYFYSSYHKTLYNPDLKWETTIGRGIGVDFGFFREKINGTIDVYWNTVKDLLVPSEIPGHSGYTSMMKNIGQTSNKGIDLALNAWVVETKDFTLNLNFNIGYNKNKIDKLADGEQEWILSSGWAGTQLLNTDDYRAYVGGRRGLIYGFVNDGFYTMDDFESFDSGTRTWTLKDGVANSKNLSGDPRPGNAKFKKLTPVDPNDPNTYVIGDNDRQVIGDTNPDFSGGFGLNATYKGFDLTLFFNYMYGFDVYNANKIMMTSWYQNTSNNLSMDVSMNNRWRNFDNMGNEIRYNPEALAKFNENATMWNPTSIGRPIAMSYAIEDGSFLRLNTASIGYTLPAALTRKAGVTRARIYATGYNLFTITSYSGYDPEVNIETGLTPNIDNNAYPRSRSYTFGVQLTF
ncbi:TonB-linked SusC/RagA family outer membrane protein [Dysgonomonas hofstadii]|uniref:TonB-linked SusC/RagA family outer membrane protein n=1 Tax=Dysgonomonas hofstadii TaxID=637886 RepID=A0A840CML0_9BACT|nr:TonB-dependent receptor [Dysgonomonas hofstadii]MBB4034235.1 TonB-linked SusC/RagA family outer membrane protein [Dysgonomonas hofstadii]